MDDSRAGLGKYKTSLVYFVGPERKYSKHARGMQKNGKLAGRGRNQDNLGIKTNNDGSWKRKRTFMEKLVTSK